MNQIVEWIKIKKEFIFLIADYTFLRKINNRLIKVAFEFIQMPCKIFLLIQKVNMHKAVMMRINPLANFGVYANQFA